jgi:hypothetical protein
MTTMMTMRAVSMLPLAFAAALLAGCAAESPRLSNHETASRGSEGTSLSDRDLTLHSPARSTLEVASPMQLSRPTPEPRSTPRPRVSRKPAPASAPYPIPEVPLAAEAAAPVPTMAVAEVTAEPEPVADAVAGAGRELAPGQTVTVISVSTHPSSAPEADDSWVPSKRPRGIIVGSGAGKCRPRGGVRGIGIAGRIPIGVPGCGLR